MEFIGVGLGMLFNSILPQLKQKMKESKLKKIAINSDIEDFRREAELLQSRLEDGYSRHEGAHKAKLLVINGNLKVLCQDTNDCIHRFLRRGSMESCTDFAKKIKRFKEKVYKLSKHTRELMDSFKEQHLERPCQYVTSSEFVGRHERLAELQELVHDLPSCKQEEPKVISIVGFAGLGKTLLANEFYNSKEALAKFHHRAWVTDAGSHEEVVKNILMEIDKGGNHAEDALDLQRLCHSLRNFLKTATEYLIVIDDMKRWKMWNDIKYTFKNVKGIVLVTTTIQEVANTCSQGTNGYVYRLSPLDKEESLKLFTIECGHKGDPGHADSHYAKEVLKKCDGLPLAIVDVANYLQSQGVLTSSRCNDACRDLGAFLVQVDDCKLERMQSVLMNIYTGLPGALRSCLLYFCMYKKNIAAVPKRNSLMWRWQAEGFVDVKTGCEYLNTLINHNIIQPMEVGTNGAARRCRPPGMVTEYISQISKSENFAASGSDLVETPNSRIRRLSLDPGSAKDERIISGMELSIVLTMAVSGEGCKEILDFKRYELIAVLDLKECTNLDESHVIHICNLVLLKYLSLGDSIDEIPKAIANLVLLETLQMRRTRETVLVHRQVLELPNLKHLLGNFKLKTKPDKELCDFLEKKSVLEMITGFVTETSKGFPNLMCHMMQLRKVKIVCDASVDQENVRDKKGKQTDDNDKDLARAIKEFIHRGSDTLGCSLSMDFGNDAGPVRMAPPLEFLKCSGSLDSLKLRGGWGTFHLPPEPFTTITGITKLCLSHTCKSGEDILATLTDMITLEYLKLEEVNLGPLRIESGTFRRLMRLCLMGETSSKQGEVEKPPNGPEPQVRDQITVVDAHISKGNKSKGKEVQFPIGAEPHVGDQISQSEDKQVKLHMGCLGCLEEIALDSGVTPTMHDAWKRAAKGHPNRPGVLLIHKAARIPPSSNA
ncbi:hypothetical protein CFC21_045035 [Triticum aestivum]|uniref:NB-ARC domain-containing protein n=3 Tax=Triticum TaxID=4564 RepID=A0A9R1R226_TRITD|nr:hypothetical protein CFC21_045035 [Triticum aestivum]VAH86697.1 unnamed protein product [Triticum turgidum subsp. durum]